MNPTHGRHAVTTRGAARCAGDVLPVAHLFMTVRQWCDDPPPALISRDSDPLYRTHGDPRD